MKFRLMTGFRVAEWPNLVAITTRSKLSGSFIRVIGADQGHLEGHQGHFKVICLIYQGHRGHLQGHWILISTILIQSVSCHLLSQIFSISNSSLTQPLTLDFGELPKSVL